MNRKPWEKKCLMTLETRLPERSVSADLKRAGSGDKVGAMEQSGDGHSTEITKLLAPRKKRSIAFEFWACSRDHLELPDWSRDILAGWVLLSLRSWLCTRQTFSTAQIFIDVELFHISD